MANIAFAALFFLVELILARDSPTAARVKTSYPFTETPAKIALLTTVAVTCGSSDVDFVMLQWLIRIDLILSYLSYSWKSFWPIVIVPVNSALMKINAAILTVIRFIRDCSYTVIIWQYDFVYWAKFEFELACCQIKEGQPVPLGRKIASGLCRICDITWDLAEWALTCCGLPVERDMGVICPTIECCQTAEGCQTAVGCRIRLPKSSFDYVEIEDVEIKVMRDDVLGEYFLGFLQHIKSGMYMYPRNHPCSQR